MEKILRPLPTIAPGLLCLAVACCVLAGCASTFRAESPRPVVGDALEVFVQADGNSYRSAKVGIFPCRAPFYAAAADHELAAIYQQEILRSGVFKQVVLIPRQIKSDGEAIWWGRREKCNLILMPEVVYMIDGSGALTNSLEIAVRIIDTRSGQLLWDFRQRASSHPGADIDLYWTTIPGASAKGYRSLARYLAQQTQLVLLPPPPPQEQAKAAGTTPTSSKRSTGGSHGA